MNSPKLLYSFDGPVADFLKSSILVVTILGLVGNTFSLITVTSKRCKKSSFTVYIGALAVVDSCLLIIHVLDTLLIGVYNVDLGGHGTAICKCIRYFQYVFRLISAWIIIAITIERVLATTYPHRFKAIYTTKFGAKVVGTLTVLMLLLCADILNRMDYSYIDQDPVCEIGYQNLTMIAIYVFTANILPLIIITMGNTAIVIKVRSSRRRIAPTTSSNNTNRHLMVITLLISSAFVICTLPIFVALSLSSFDDTNDMQRQAVFSVALTLYNLNFATNFYLYILSGRRFRELFISAIMCNQRRTPAQVTTGHQKKSSQSRKSPNMAARKRQFVTGSPGNTKKVISIQDDMTNTTRVTSLQDDMTSTVIQPYDTTRVTSLQDDTTSTVIQPYDTTRVTSLQADMTSTVIQPYDTTRVPSLQDDMTSTVIQPYDTTRVASLQDDMTSTVIQPYDTTRVTSLQDDMTSPVIQPYDTTRFASLQDDTTGDVIQPYDTTRVTSLQDDMTSTVIQPYDTTRVTSLQDDTTGAVIQPYDTTRVTSLQDDMTSNVIQPYDTTRVASLQDDTTGAVIQP